MSRQSPKKQIASRDTASERISHAIGENAMRLFGRRRSDKGCAHKRRSDVFVHFIPTRRR